VNARIYKHFNLFSMGSNLNFIRRINARALLKSTAHGEEEIRLLDKHLQYIKAFLVKEEILNSPGEEYIVYSNFFNCVDAGDKTFRIAEILESMHPAICKDILYLSSKAMAYFQNDDSATAIELYEEAIRLQPRCEPLYHCRAFLQRMIGNSRSNFEQTANDRETIEL